MNDIRAIFLDFDGTAYSHKSDCFPASTIKAVRKLREKGVLVFLCTGRSLGEMGPFNMEQIPLDGWIMSNGQVIVDENRQIIYKDSFEGKLKEKVISLYNEKTIPMYLVTVDDIYINLVNQTVLDIQATVSSDTPKIKDYEGEEIFMASAFFSNETEKERLREFEDYAEITWWHDGAIDIVPKGSSKVNGIDVILKRFHIGRSQTMAIGDGQNDIPMIEHCGIGVAVGNAIEELKQYADYITDDVDDDGVYNAFLHYGLL